MFEKKQLGMNRSLYVKFVRGEKNLKFDEYVLKGKHPRRTIHTEMYLNKLILMYAVHEDTTLLDSYESYNNPNARYSHGRGYADN